MPGDVIFIVGGVLPFLWITWLGIRHTRKATTSEVPMEALYTDLEHAAQTSQPPGAARYGSEARGSDLDMRASERSRWRSQRRGTGTRTDDE
jgi:nitric oxide reductase subunit B